MCHSAQFIVTAKKEDTDKLCENSCLVSFAARLMLVEDS